MGTWIGRDSAAGHYLSVQVSVSVFPLFTAELSLAPCAEIAMVTSSRYSDCGVGTGFVVKVNSLMQFCFREPVLSSRAFCSVTHGESVLPCV